MTITGASGAGKTTLENSLLQHFGGGRVRTITTRVPREGETAANYDFQSEDSLAEMANLLWCLPIHNAVYAVALPEFDKAAAETNGLAFVSITPERHEFLANHFTPNGVRCVAVHLAHPGENELRRRLELRGEDATSVDKRLKDSVIFEQSAVKVANLNIIRSGTPAEVLHQVLSIIEVTP